MMDLEEMVMARRVKLSVCVPMMLGQSGDVSMVRSGGGGGQQQRKK